eukprot:TRINITY_DN39013_c0_g1_i2.p1 TRINITY_DN39013_c0_g1~~TRINITY_DN39013_c0_g1_i2.p1  ORF type:complete len:126 (+),score=5.06 TRINITY_DN39013_c0_g1_i2:114-491(+)
MLTASVCQSVMCEGSMDGIEPLSLTLFSSSPLMPHLLAAAQRSVPCVTAASHFDFCPYIPKHRQQPRLQGCRGEPTWASESSLQSVKAPAHEPDENHRDAVRRKHPATTTHHLVALNRPRKECGI